jgi:hypothetical protein
LSGTFELQDNTKSSRGGTRAFTTSSQSVTPSAEIELIEEFFHATDSEQKELHLGESVARIGLFGEGNIFSLGME